MIRADGVTWASTSVIAEGMGLSVRTVQRYVAAGLVRKRGGLRCVEDVAAAEKSRRERMQAGGRS